ncbi:family 10 glycoside hydrolase [Melampsora larici-populina 98AG31]|uniref:Family 10 glycoside hydrolase n=1 Tax=Melampsora larici-populina (strain 98AG31 / pathotype 3-4-7) TaxID=747676 RepID=F4S1R4_MELLP|nr:family 10 glycoside hydrolase [Melampsora larici-populina 98AG31]EGG01421.1 family 10 glycoside hydrolase [Melampsora larici-populina 98AG31]
MRMPATKSDMEQEVQDYQSVVETCLSVDRCLGITICGVGYKDSWIPSTFKEITLWLDMYVH